jgi:hypothetical protein
LKRENEIVKKKVNIKKKKEKLNINLPRVKKKRSEKKERVKQKNRLLCWTVPWVPSQQIALDSVGKKKNRTRLAGPLKIMGRHRRAGKFPASARGKIFGSSARCSRPNDRTGRFPAAAAYTPPAHVAASPSRPTKT